MKKQYRLFLTLLFLFGCLTQGITQTRGLKKFVSSEKDSTRSSSFLPLPAIAYAQETGLEFGVISLYSFYTDKKDLFTRNSSITGVASFTTKKQANFKLQTDIWAPQNKYHYISEIRYKDFPFNFYGVGGATLKSDEDKITQKLFKLQGEVEKLFSRRYYGGISAGFESYSFTDKATGGIFSTDPTILDKDGGRVFYMGISQGYDTRNTNTYTTKGTLIKVNYSFAPDFFGGDNFTGSLFKADFRNFRNFNEKTVLAIQVVYQSLIGDNAPFYLMPQMGNDQMMRGYYTGRYRDKNLLAAQAELRYRLIPKLGAVAFLGAGSVYHEGSFDLGDLKPSRGAGLRYFFDVDRGLSIRLDYGIGEKRPNEKRQKGFYVSLAEAF